MKKLFSLCLFSIFPGTSLFSQSLSGITWEGYQAGMLIGYYKFNSGNLEYSQSSSNFSVVANHTLSANGLTVTNIPASAACPVTDVGIYTFSFITNDVVKFTIVSDPCAARKSAFTNFVWMRQGTTGIISLLAGPEAKSLGQNAPNPFSDKTRISFSIPKFTKESFLVVQDLCGREVVRYPLDKNNDYIEIYHENLSEGIYVYTLICDGYVSPSMRMVVSGH